MPICVAGSFACAGSGVTGRDSISTHTPGIAVADLMSAAKEDAGCEA